MRVYLYMEVANAVSTGSGNAKLHAYAYRTVIGKRMNYHYGKRQTGKH